MDKEGQQEWTTVIRPKGGWMDFSLRDLYRYRDLVVMLMKRYFATMYKQTILGPLWIVINPLLTTVFFTVIFGNIAQLSTDGVPALLFYMAGTTVWTLFSTSLTNASTTFVTNSEIFGKVYFPRLTVPISATLCACVNFAVQFAMFLLFYAYYYFFSDAVLQPNGALALVPVLMLLAAVLGMAVGIIVTALTTKYKDLNVLVSFAVQLWMYATPIVYPLSSTGGLARVFLLINPMTPIVEGFRYAFMGVGEVNWPFLGLSAAVTGLLLLLGLVLFNRVEKTFVDTI